MASPTTAKSGGLRLKAAVNAIVSASSSAADERRVDELRETIRSAASDAIRNAKHAAFSEEQLIGDTAQTFFDIVSLELRSQRDLVERLRAAEAELDFVSAQVRRRDEFAAKQRGDMLREIQSANELVRQYVMKYNDLVEHARLAGISLAGSTGGLGMSTAAGVPLPQSQGQGVGGPTAGMPVAALDRTMPLAAGGNSSSGGANRRMGNAIAGNNPSNNNNTAHQQQLDAGVDSAPGSLAMPRLTDPKQLERTLEDERSRLMMESESKSAEQQTREEMERRVKDMQIRLRREHEVVVHRTMKRGEETLKSETAKLESKVRQLEQQLRRKEAEAEIQLQKERDRWRLQVQRATDIAKTTVMTKLWDAVRRWEEARMEREDDRAAAVEQIRSREATIVSLMTQIAQRQAAATAAGISFGAAGEPSMAVDADDLPSALLSPELPSMPPQLLIKAASNVGPTAANRRNVQKSRNVSVLSPESLSDASMNMSVGPGAGIDGRGPPDDQSSGSKSPAGSTAPAAHPPSEPSCDRALIAFMSGSRRQQNSAAVPKGLHGGRKNTVHAQQGRAAASSIAVSVGLNNMPTFLQTGSTAQRLSVMSSGSIKRGSRLGLSTSRGSNMGDDQSALVSQLRDAVETLKKNLTIASMARDEAIAERDTLEDIIARGQENSDESTGLLARIQSNRVLAATAASVNGNQPASPAEASAIRLMVRAVDEDLKKLLNDFMTARQSLLKSTPSKVIRSLPQRGSTVISSELSPIQGSLLAVMDSQSGDSHHVEDMLDVPLESRVTRGSTSRLSVCTDAQGAESSQTHIFPVGNSVTPRPRPKSRDSPSNQQPTTPLLFPQSAMTAASGGPGRGWSRVSQSSPIDGSTSPADFLQVFAVTPTTRPRSARTRVDSHSHTDTIPLQLTHTPQPPTSSKHRNQFS